MIRAAYDELTDGVPSAPATRASAEPPHGHVSVGQSIARGAFALLSTQPLTWATSLLTVVLAPRLLGSDVLGQLTVAGTISTIAITLSGVGVSEFLVRRVAQSPQSLRRDTGIALTVQAAGGTLAFVVVLLIGAFYGSAIVPLPLLVAVNLGILIAPAQTVLLSAFRGCEQHQRYAWFCAAVSSVTGLASLVVLLLGGNVVAAALVGTILYAAVTGVAWRMSGLRPEWPRSISPMLSEAREFVRAGLPFMGWQITQLAYSQIDRLLLGVLVPASQVGWYAAASRISSIPIFIPTLIVTPLFPALSRNAHTPDILRRSITETLRITLLLTIPIAAGTVVVAPALPSLLGWPEDFSNSVLPARILAVQFPLVAVGMVLGSVLMAIGREHRMVVVAVLATVFNVGMNLVAIPAFERWTGNAGIGAALVTLASEVVMLLGALALIPKALLSATTLWDLARISGGGIATLAAGLALMPVALPLAVLGGALAYLAVTFGLGVLSVADMRLIVQQVRRR